MGAAFMEKIDAKSTGHKIFKILMNNYLAYPLLKSGGSASACQNLLNNLPFPSVRPDPNDEDPVPKEGQSTEEVRGDDA
jgi:hypothetical protein